MKAPKPQTLFFLTDFGLRDAYAGTLHAVALSLLTPLSRAWTTLSDLTHAVPPQQIATASWHLLTTLPYCPPHSVFVCVVDPAVGDAEQHHLLAWRKDYEQVFIAPDNGLLAPLIERYGLEVYRLTNNRYRWPMAKPVGSAGYGASFQGRDTYTPVAAFLLNHWSEGKPTGAFLAQAGERVESWKVLSNFTLQAEPMGENAWQAQVLHCDQFGNVITNLKADQLPPEPPKAVHLSHPGQEDAIALPWASHYQAVSVGDLLALVGSHGYVELAANQGNAQKRLGLSALQALDISLKQ